ncbi:50S ribosomal protein L29 [Williamsoniiplasma luminosum]|uniref:Large ribosomal subunit protein uL29 n=1 Tax=Williamsoniiplasma luminosum TaxID=214888 RepID=A0A2K8NW98_9MOLU|nr:50S ribosomal protein L29 [Williamsoniiplasma luminosum]ATZ17011.1 50S ribosomal protein L29 [Williamsoniiplasma luminosum]AVP49676.1 MAG: 50S ribosomal protein L29 [Williamsoniiplasma luminosum]
MAKQQLKPIEQLRSSTTIELIGLSENKRAELFALKFQAAVGSLEQTHKIKLLKREIARIELVLSEKKKAGENTNINIKGDYHQAVENAEKSGKQVRQKQREQIEKLQAEQFGPTNDMDMDAIKAAMENASDETNNNEEGTK